MDSKACKKAKCSFITERWHNINMRYMPFCDLKDEFTIHLTAGCEHAEIW